MIGKKVIVIGAGIAGLAAAGQLKSMGAEVIVLEARDRIGGRIWTSNQWKGMPVDLGASWIHGVKGNPITKIADIAKIRRVSTSYESAITLDETGKERDITLELEAAETQFDHIRTLMENRETDISIKNAVESSSYWKSASPAQKRIMRHFINSTIEQEYGGSWSKTSTWYFDEASEFKGEDVFFPGGYQQIIDILAKDLTISINQEVNSIAPKGKGVTIGLKNGQSLSADIAIVTVPLGVLKAQSIAFGAKLSAKKSNAIAMLQMGLLNKSWLRFEKTAWPDDIDWIEFLGSNDGYWAEWVSMAQAVKQPILLGFNAGDQATELEKQSDSAIISQAHNTLKKMFGSRFPAPIAMQNTRWLQDPFSRGSYSFNALGIGKNTRKEMAASEWDGRLLFAGEASSSDHPNTVHGAYLSGIDAAKAIS